MAHRFLGRLLALCALPILLSACADTIVYEPPAPVRVPHPPQPDLAGNMQFEAVSESTDSLGSRRSCAHQAPFCAFLRADRNHGWTLLVAEEGHDPRPVAVLPRLAPRAGYSFGYELWRDAGGAWLIEISRIAFVGDARGWSSITTSLLYRYDPAATDARLVLDLPVSSTLTTYPCPGARHGETARCVIDHVFGAGLVFDAENREGPPRFVVTASAEIAPGPHVRRPAPGASLPYQREADPACAYRRLYIFDSATGRYAPDTPVPDCRRYFELDRWAEFPANPDMSDWRSKPH